MAKPKHEAIKLVKQAIRDTGTTSPEMVSLRVEEIVQEKIKDWKCKEVSYLYSRLARYGIRKYSDVVKLVDEVGRAV